MTLPGAEKVGDKVIEAGDMLVFSAGFPAVYGKQILFFKDPVFLERSQIPPPPATDRIFALDPALANGALTAALVAPQPDPIEASIAPTATSQPQPDLVDASAAIVATPQTVAADTVATTSSASQPTPGNVTVAPVPVPVEESPESAKYAPGVAEVGPILLTSSESTEDEPQREGVKDEDEDGEATVSEDQTDSLADFLP
jgi:type IV secretion system protein VirD4